MQFVKGVVCLAVIADWCFLLHGRYFVACAGCSSICATGKQQMGVTFGDSDSVERAGIAGRPIQGYGSDFSSFLCSSLGKSSRL